jgi:hypothetical protein
VTHSLNPGFDGYRVQHRRKVFHDAGIEVIYAKGCALTLYEVRE